jgi:ubiquinone/menaquinone biosynthesis C-methylase UbiE
MTTDSEWQAWGIRDPYYAVLTNPKYRSAALTSEAKLVFFESGKRTADRIFDMCRRYIDANFAPQRILDFGCGVGRMSIPFAAHAREVVGMDVAESMLTEARLNCDTQGCRNVTLIRSDDTLSAATGQFDLVHSCLVLQHLEVARGRALFAELVGRVQPGGCGVIQVTFGWDKYEATFGVVPEPPVVPPSPKGLFSQFRSVGRLVLGRLGLPRKGSVIEPLPDAKSADPEMQMNYYNLSELMFILQRAGVQRVFTEFSNHGGALGVFLCFQKALPRG